MSILITLRAVAGSFVDADALDAVPSESRKALTSSALADGFWRAQILTEHTVLWMWGADVAVANVAGTAFAGTRRVVAFGVFGAQRWEGNAVGRALFGARREPVSDEAVSADARSRGGLASGQGVACDVLAQGS